MLPRLTGSILLLTALTVAMPALADPVEYQSHWAWKKPERPSVPVVEPQPINPIDAFIRTKLKAAGLSSSPRASREQLIRRVTFDLTGLPPTPEEVAAFVADRSPDAWEKVIDRLLARPRYGERWARHWLDLARYADTNGYEFDEPRPDAWRYRDYVIRSFNADKPFDRFIIEQLAGDEAFPGDPDALIATGFNLLGPDMTDSSDQAQRRQNTLNDMTDTAGLAFLGLTITCARCHDHKFEPISQKDYFRLQAFFTPAAFRRDLPVATAPKRKRTRRQQREYLELTKDSPRSDRCGRRTIPPEAVRSEAREIVARCPGRPPHPTREDEPAGNRNSSRRRKRRSALPTPKLRSRCPPTTGQSSKS